MKTRLVVWSEELNAIFLLFILISVMPSAVLVPVKTEGGLPQQTEAKTVWSSFGTHLQRKAPIHSIFC